MRKKILCVFIITISLFIYINKVNATVMWMQCTADANGRLRSNNNIQSGDFDRYNTFAVVNSMDGGTRPLLYIGSQNKPGDNFFEVKGPTLVMNKNQNGTARGDVCWFEKEPADSSFTECEVGDYEDAVLVSVDKLKSGICPEAVYQTTGYDTSGATKGDFVVMVGTNNGYKTETLNTWLLAMYKVYIPVNAAPEYGGFVPGEYWIIEAYNSSGQYGYATTFTHGISNDNLDFTDVGSIMSNGEIHANTFPYMLGLYPHDSINSVLDDDFDSDDDFVNYTMYTQIMRIYGLGKDYYKINNKSVKGARLIEIAREIGGSRDVGIQFAIKTEDKTTEIYADGDTKYDESNTYIKEWLSDGTNFENLNGESEKLKEFGNDGKYAKVYKEATKISEAMKKGTKYNFPSDYPLQDVVKDLDGAYSVLKELKANSDDAQYTGFDSECKPYTRQVNTENAALASAYSYFACKTFETLDFNKLLGDNKKKVVESVLQSYVNNQILSAVNSSDQDLFNRPSNVISALAKAISYIKSNNFEVEGYSKEQIEELFNNYLELARSFGVEIVVDCPTLLGTELKERLLKYVDAVKIAVPIILLGFGIIDFGKAVFSGDDDAMKKAQKDFIKRVGIAVLFFLVPTLIKLLLNIANNVWAFISPNSCDLF